VSSKKNKNLMKPAKCPPGYVWSNKKGRCVTDPADRDE